MTYEAGLQALDPRNFSGPMWEQLTGIKSNVVELSNPDQYSKAVAEHIAGSGAYDVLDITPTWTPSLADGGVIAPLDDYIAKYMNMADLEDYHPLYKALPTYKGKIWGFFDDGDMFALYYRKDIFEDPKMMEAYQAKFNAPLGPPKTWEEYAQIAQFITDQMAPNVYGAGHFRKAGSPGNQFDFLQQYRANGGKLFGDDMKAGLASDAGVKTLKNMIAANAASIPGNNELDAVSLWAAFLTGKVAMIYSWPPTGVWSANYSQSDTAINFVPQSQIAGKVGYAVVPGNPEHAAGFNKALSADSANMEAAYLFMQWVTSPPVSLARVHAALRAARSRTGCHTSSRNSMPSSSRAPGSTCTTSTPPPMSGCSTRSYPVRRTTTSASTAWHRGLGRRAIRMASLTTAAAEWDDTTDRLGADSQKAFYTEFLKLPGATADNTVEKLGMAVKL